MKCQNCGKQLPSHPEDAVEQGELEEVVGHKINGGGGITVSKKNYYCDPECFVEAKGGKQ